MFTICSRIFTFCLGIPRNSLIFENRAFYTNRRMKIKVLSLGLISALSALPALVVAQTDPMFTHFTFNKILYNPAYAGASGQFCLNGITHQQWRGYDDESSLIKTDASGNGRLTSDNYLRNVAPRTNGLGFSAPILVKGNNYGGAFFAVMHDKIAYETNIYMRGGLSGAYTLSTGGSLRLGLDFTSYTKQLDVTKLRYHDPGDPNIPTSSNPDTKMELGVGAYYSDPNIMDGAFLGVSITHLNPQTFSYGPSGTVNITTNRHLYIVGGYKQENFLGNQALRLEPAFLLKTVMGKGGLIKPQLDLQGLATWNDLFAGGVNMRVYGAGFESFALMFGYYPPLLGGSNTGQRLRIGYSYDLSTNRILRASGGSHELQVNYCFMVTLPDRPPVRYRHPLWMDRPPMID